MNPKKFYILILSLLLINLSNATNYEFNDLVVFGDSISDGGRLGRQSRYIAGGMESKMYNDYLSETLTGKKLTPFTFGGTNYAIAGSKANSDRKWYSSGFPIITDSISEYLNQNNNKVDPNNLYVLFIGGNDVTDSVYSYYATFIPKLIKGETYNINSNNFALNDTPKEIARNAQRLLDAGAKYVLVSNIFDAELVPLNLILPAVWLDSILGGFIGIKNFYSFESLLGSILDAGLRQNDNIPPANFPHSGEIYLKNMISSIVIIPGTIGTFFLNNTELTGILTKQINYSTELELEKINGNIVYIDIYSLIHEIIDNPKIYGIDDILLPVCTLGRSSLYCNKNDNAYHNEKHYLWSDWFHPSPEIHKIIADYMIAVFNGPLYVSAISELLESNNEQAKNFLNSKLFYLKNNNYESKFNTFINYFGSKNTKNFSFAQDRKNSFINNLNLGITYNLNSNLLLGSMLTVSDGKYSPYKSFKYTYHNEIINLFTQLNFQNGFWTNLYVDFGRIRAHNIKRSFAIGNYIRTETGATRGYNKGIGVNLGYDFNLNQNISFTTFTGSSWDNYKIDGYQEHNQNSTSMKFANQSRNKSFVNLGMMLNTKNYPINGYIKIDFNYALKNEPIVIKSSIKTTKTAFNREINFSKKEWLNLQTGINTNIKKNIMFNANIGYKTNDNRNKQIYYYTGLNINF